MRVSWWMLAGEASPEIGSEAIDPSAVDCFPFASARSCVTVTHHADTLPTMPAFPDDDVMV